MEVTSSKVYTGHPDQVIPNLRRRVSAYTRQSVYEFKVGYTHDPRQRAISYGDAYDQMVVLYKSTSDRNARQVERALIEYNRDLASNERAGGGGSRSSSRHYYVYLVRRRRLAQR